MRAVEGLSKLIEKMFMLLIMYLFRSAQGLVSLHPRATLLKDLGLLSGLNDNAVGRVV